MQPAVLGSSRTPQPSSIAAAAGRRASTRRSATVTISVPEAAMAALQDVEAGHAAGAEEQPRRDSPR